MVVIKQKFQNALIEDMKHCTKFYTVSATIIDNKVVLITGYIN